MRAAPLLLLLAGATGCGSCLNLGGRAYPCEMDSGLPSECPAKWRCGLEQSGQPRCHPIGRPGPFVCATDEACEGWHCGADSVCYDRADAGAIACREGELDCAPGWRCNTLSQTCQNQDAGEPYACVSDDDCEQRWRCGLDGLCLDATREALRPAAPGLVVARASPPWTVDGPVSHFAASPPQFGPVATAPDGGAIGAIVSAYALVSGQTAHLLEVSSLDPAFGSHHAAGIPPGVTGLAATRGRAFIATDAGLFRMTGGTVEPFAALGGAQLQVSDEVPAVLAAWADRDLLVASTAADAGVLVTAPAGVNAVGFGGQGWMWTASDAGLFLSPPSGGIPAFFPLSLPPLRAPCADAGGDLPLGAVFAGSGLIVEVQPDDGGRAALDVFTGGGSPSAQACSTQGYTFVNHCPVCPAGTQTRVYRAGLGNLSNFTACCISPTQRTRFRVNPAGCVVTFDGDDGPGVTNRGSGQRAGVTPSGTIVDEDQRVTPGTAAVAAGAATDFRLFDQRPGAADVTFALQDPVAVSVPSAGLAQVCAAVAGSPLVVGTRADLNASAPDRGVYVFPLQRDPRAVGSPLGLLDGTSAYGVFQGTPAPSVLPVSCFEDGEPIFQAATGTTRDGGEVLVVGGEDRLWALETARMGLDGGATRLLVRTVPAVAGRFQSVAMVATPGLAGTDHAVGYALVSSRLFRIRARSSSSWLSEELPLPEGEPIAVWADGANGRVGYADGRVFSAASRLQLALPTPTAVRAFASICGEGFALTADALLRLIPGADGGPLGTWVPVDLTNARLPPLAGARIYGSNRDLLVTTPGGVVGRLAVPACGQ